MIGRMVFWALLEVLLSVSSAQAAGQNSQQSVLAYEIPGNPRCWNVAAGARELRVPKLPRGGSGVVSDPSGPTIRYAVGPDGRSLSWEVQGGDSVPALQRVNIVLLGTVVGSFSRAYYLPLQGVTQDMNETTQLPINQIAFCYGLAGAPAGGGASALPHCDSGCRVDPVTNVEATQVLLRGEPGIDGRWEPCACGQPIDEQRAEACTPTVDNNCDTGWFCYKSGGRTTCVYR
ncbi:MAG: hypothetical protein U1E83_01525 [Methylotetracoccus sp.]